jgi:hypothetical protein
VHCLCGGEEGLAHLANRFDLQSRASGGDGGRLVTRDAGRSVWLRYCALRGWLVGWYLEVQRDQREYKAFEILHQVVKVLQALWISALVYFE